MVVLQGAPASLGIKVMGYKFHGMKYQAGLITLALQAEPNEKTIKYIFDQLLKDTAFPNNHCTNVHGISIII